MIKSSTWSATALLLLSVLTLLSGEVSADRNLQWLGSKTDKEDICAQNIWPIFAGGSSNDLVNCFAIDPVKRLVVIGGNTTSSDFAPAANEHGYLYALDFDGNFMWGRFFYNVSYAISDISGCAMASDGSTLSVLGKGKSQPIIMEMDIVKGTSIGFYSLEYYLTSDRLTPDYSTWGGLYFDKKDYFSGKQFYYTAFTKDNLIEMVRLEIPKSEKLEPRVDWAYEFYAYTTAEATDLYRRQEPMSLFMDPVDNQVFYMTGRYHGRASVMRFNKINGRLRWYSKMANMTTVRAHAMVNNTRFFYACGDFETADALDNLASAQHTAAVFRMDNNGNMIWYSVFTGTTAAVSTSTSTTYYNQDRCYGLSYNDREQEVTALLQIKMTELRESQFQKADFYDIALVLMDMNGRPKKSVTISWADAQYDIFLTNNALLTDKTYYYWAGWSYGYSTRVQTNQTALTATVADYDAFTFRYDWDMDYYTCLFTKEYSSSKVRAVQTIYGASQVRSVGLWERFESDIKVRKTQKQAYFIPYQSKYSGGFALLDSMKIPRPCAYKSYNLTSVNYYRGQNTYSYKLSANNSHQFVATMMSEKTSRIIFQKGGFANDSLALYDKGKYVVNISTNEESMVGIQRTIIRDCDAMGRLLELNLYIDVLSNTHPDFTTEMQTTFTLNVNDNFTYRLPPIKDSDENDVPEVYIKTMEAQEDQYPPFLAFDNKTRSLVFRPREKNEQGKIFYFTTIVKEKNSDTILYPYYCTVKIEGQPLQYKKHKKEVPIDYQIQWLDKSSQGKLYFSHPVNFTWLEDNFYLMFNIYWRDTTYKASGDKKTNHTLKDFELTKFDHDNQTIKFTMVFDEPYLLGLLIKKSDTLFINVRDDFEPDGLFIWDSDKDNITSSDPYKQWLIHTNTTVYKLKENSAQKRIPLLFDWNNQMMKTMRRISANSYWVLIAIILIQFALLLVRQVGLLTLWILIEYLQLVAFMPIYNFRLIPYLYDAFKPTLVAHMIIFDEWPFWENFVFDNDYFNENYKNYWLSIGRLFQAFVATIILAIIVIITHGIFLLIHELGCRNRHDGMAQWVRSRLEQFKFNAYIRYYMLVYFDLTFFSVMKIIEGDNSSTLRKFAVLLSYVLFIVSIVMPVFLISIIFRRFAVLKLKEAKKSFNTLLLKIDKGSKWRVINPAYFFARRLLTALLLTLPIENTFIFLQYVFILMSSHAYILYIVAVKPYQTPGYNSYVLANETFYSALIIAIFIFSDATPELNIKIGAGVALMSSLILLIIANLVMNVAQMYYGRDALKRTIRESKLKRAEKEALEEAEEQERRLKKKKEEEEFTRLPDESTMGGLPPNSQTMDQSNTTHGNTTLSELNLKSGKKKGRKGEDDSVTEGTIGGMQTTEYGNTKKRRNKNKEKEDDVNDYPVPADDTPQPARGARRKKTRKAQPQNDQDTGSNEASKKQ